jgi:alkylation response protein AidB-like acyl-CoA dehydrogenase
MADPRPPDRLFGATIAPEYGGLGMPVLTYVRIVARMSEVWMSLSGVFSSHLMMATAVQRFGTEEQKQRFLPRFASGDRAVAWRSPSPTAAPICRRSAPAPCTMATTT